MKIYISIPITGHDIVEQQRKANEVAEKLRAKGHEPVSPFDTPQAPEGLTAKEEYAYYMGEDIKKLLTCDGIVMCNGWGQSKGCVSEYHTAVANMLFLMSELALEMPEEGKEVKDDAQTTA